MLHRFQNHATTHPAPSDIATQIDWVASHYRHPLLIFVVSDEPDADPRLDDLLTRLTGRHDVLWAMVSDAPAVGSAEDERNGYDVGGGGFVLSADLDTGVVDAYRRAETARREHLSQFMTAHGVPHAMVRGSLAIRNALLSMTGTYARAG
jgi:hypothetical protein